MHYRIIKLYYGTAYSIKGDNLIDCSTIVYSN